MGVNDRKQDRKDDAAKLRKAKRDERMKNAPKVDTSTIDWASLHYCLNRMIAAGGALRIGATRDGGAWAFGIYGLGDPYTEYVKPTEDVNEYLNGLGGEFEDTTG